MFTYLRCSAELLMWSGKLGSHVHICRRALLCTSILYYILYGNDWTFACMLAYIHYNACKLSVIWFTLAYHKSIKKSRSTIPFYSLELLWWPVFFYAKDVPPGSTVAVFRPFAVVSFRESHVHAENGTFGPVLYHKTSSSVIGEYLGHTGDPVRQKKVIP